MERSELNWRGVAIFGLAVLTVIVLIRVIDDEPARLGVNTAGTSQDSGDSTVSTTLPGTTETTKPGTTQTTKPGTPATTAFVAAGKPTLQAGSTGADVTLVQQRLTTLGFYKGTADGSYGPATVAAVKEFQTSKGLAADGSVGPTTWDALAA